jgi:hypothetical protein
MSSNSGNNDDTGKRPAASGSGSMIAAGIPIGAGFGVALGLALDNLALGIAIGAALGVALGAALEQNRRRGPADAYGTHRPPLWIAVAVGLLLLGVALATLVLLVLN